MRQTARSNISKPLTQYLGLIGIDPGVNTGITIRDKGEKTMTIETMTIVDAMAEVLWAVGKFGRENVIVRIEDARMRTWFGEKGREALQGAGSIKRDCQIWQEFFERHGIVHEFVPPKKNRTKMDAAFFQKMTGHKGRTSVHGRDSAMLVHGI